MSTFTRSNGHTRCDACKAPVADTWPAKARHYLDHHTPAQYRATRHAGQEES